MELLESKIKRFYKKRYLFKYLINKYDIKCSESSFRAYILKNQEINDKFKKHNSKPTTTLRFETEEGKQAQVDWKESVKVILKDSTEVVVNIFTYILAHSRYRVNILSLSKSRKEILFDNMKTVMDEARTSKSEGKINENNIPKINRQF